MRRTQNQWSSLIQEQQRSGLSATAFCKKRGINPKYFSLRKNRLPNSLQNKAKAESFVRLSAPLPPQTIQLYFGALNLSIPASYPVDAIAELMRALR